MNELNDDARAGSPSMSQPLSPPPWPAPPTPVRRGGCLRLFVAVSAVIGAFTVLIVLLGVVVVGRMAGQLEQFAHDALPAEGEFGEDEFPTLSETWSAGQGDLKVVRIPLRGGIFLRDDASGWGRAGDADATSALQAIRRATRDPEVAGLLLEIDSGGGGITASDILYDAVLNFKRADTNRIVVAHMGDMAASGAYYLCLAADRILAHPTTVTGSIGVILTSLNVREMTEKLGIKDVSVKSGGNKDILNPMTEMTPEQRAMLQELVDQLHSRFVGLVSQHRQLPPEAVRALADGRIFLAPQAQQLHLIDGLGYTADAQVAVEDLVGESVRFVRYSRQTSLRDLLRSPAFWGAALSEALPRASRETAFQLR